MRMDREGFFSGDRRPQWMSCKGRLPARPGTCGLRRRSRTESLQVHPQGDDLCVDADPLELLGGEPAGAHDHVVVSGTTSVDQVGHGMGRPIGYRCAAIHDAGQMARD